jgi:hypothetical protein
LKVSCGVGVGGAADPGEVRVKTETGTVTVEPVRGSRAFEILGFDIMIDQNLKPWLLEVNTLPRSVRCGVTGELEVGSQRVYLWSWRLCSFATESKIDETVKRTLIDQALQVVKARPDDQRSVVGRLIYARVHGVHACDAGGCRWQELPVDEEVRVGAAAA